MQAILEKLGNPHKKLPPTIHLAGTNGKGSTLAFLRAMLEAAGKSVHTYTTPHMVQFNERIHLAGVEISDDYLYEIMEKVRVAAEGLKLGFYESTTAGALLAFSEVEADYLLLETGMGGRLDATNIIENPVMCTMATISKDHTKFLGDDLRLIAGEKVWIIKQGAQVVCSMQHDEVHEIVENWCVEKGAELTSYGYDFGIDKTAQGLLLQTPEKDYQFGEPSLLGYHQYINAGTAAIAALKLGLDIEAIGQGVKSASWPSRLEKIEKSWIEDDFEFYLDGGHNPAAAYALAGFMEDEWADKPTYLIYGTTRGRDTSEFLEKFAGKVQHLALVKVNAEPDSYDPQEMQAPMEATTHDSIKEAVKHIQENFSPGRILCCGSLFMRGDII